MRPSETEAQSSNAPPGEEGGNGLGLCGQKQTLASRLWPSPSSPRGRPRVVRIRQGWQTGMTYSIVALVAGVDCASGDVVAHPMTCGRARRGCRMGCAGDDRVPVWAVAAELADLVAPAPSLGSSHIRGFTLSLLPAALPPTGVRALPQAARLSYAPPRTLAGLDARVFTDLQALSLPCRPTYRRQTTLADIDTDIQNGTQVHTTTPGSIALDTRQGPVTLDR